MNVSKKEQRVLHALAQGGRIVIERDGPRKLTRVECITREGWFLTDCDETIFRKLRRRKLIRSVAGGPYRITREGLSAVASRPDNR